MIKDNIKKLNRPHWAGLLARVEKIEEPIRLNDFYQRRENEISHLSRGKLYWNQEVHKIFRENEYFILVKTQTFSEKWIS